MIGHFPTPLPDELFYSTCARYGARVDYSSVGSLMLELFGDEATTASIDLPSRLNHFTSALPHGSALKAERIIEQHTLLPFHAHFLPTDRVKQIQKSMRQSNGAVSYMRAGLTASRIPTPTHLKFCPGCVREDRKSEEAYWRRLHQFSGVEVCHIHNVFLEKSGVSLRAARRQHQFVSAEGSILNLTSRSLDLDDKDHQALLNIARDAAWLLEHPSNGNELEALYNRYLRILNGRGLAIFTGNIRVEELLNEFREFYSADLLQLLHCEFSGSNHRKTNWLLKLVRQPRNSHHPLYHLLLIRFLGYTTEEFFSLPAELNLFGEGPWPCLNPAAEHYRQPVVTDFRYAWRQRHGRPRGIFTCHCGFSFIRSGPDSSPEDRFRVGRIHSYGPIWEDKLRKLWKNPAITLTDIRRKLGVDYLTVIRHAERLRLSQNRPGRRAGKLSTKLRLKSNPAQYRRKRNSYRSKWLSAIKRFPQSSITELGVRLPGPYQWMLHNDRAWLKRNSPEPTGRKHYSTASVDWDARDRFYVTQVRETAARLKERSGRPLRVTKGAILREIGATWISQKQGEKLPLTSQALNEMVESLTDYTIRRVWWAANCFLEEGVIPRESQIVDKANVYKIKHLPEIQQAIKDGLRMIETKCSSVSLVKAAS